MSLAQGVLGDEKQCLLRTGLDALRIAAAEIALEGIGKVGVEEDRSERAGDDALLARNALLAIDIVDTVLGHDGGGGTGIAALRLLAVAAYDGHPDYRMRIDGDDPYARFLGITDPESLDGAHDLAETTAGTAFRDHGEFLGHHGSLPLLELRWQKLAKLNRGLGPCQLPKGEL